ncbi:MAG: hypothetical protein FWE23_02875 [Chitinivibrionia bacterium]|nr:hypothetical protein [Chitinivibrionia bacterium]
MSKQSEQEKTFANLKSKLTAGAMIIALIFAVNNTTQHNTTQHNTTQHNTTQHNTTQHNTTQHNTTHIIIQSIIYVGILQGGDFSVEKFLHFLPLSQRRNVERCVV